LRLPTTATPASHPGQVRAAALLLALAAALAGPAVEASGEAPRAACEGEKDGFPLDRAVKAAYVYNFARFVSWPAESPFTLAPAFTFGVLGDDSFADALEAVVRGKKVGGRSVAVQRFGVAEDVVPCPVLYVGHARPGDLRPLLDRLRGWPVLTVGDAAGFASRGGVISLYSEDDRIRFVVRRSAARAARLGVSSKLLRLSRPEPDRSDPACVVGSEGER
jgi:hypothetical protein